MRRRREWCWRRLLGKGERIEELNVWLKGIHRGARGGGTEEAFLCGVYAGSGGVASVCFAEDEADGKVSRSSGSLAAGGVAGGEGALCCVCCAIGSARCTVLEMPVRGDEFVGDLAAGGDDVEVMRPPVLKRLPLGFDARARLAGAARLPYGARLRGLA